MELTSSLAELLRLIDREPIIMVFFSAFGIILYMIILGLLLWPFNRVFKNTFMAKAVETYFYAVLISWLLGFISQIILFFCGISGLHLVAIWLLMHIITVMFCSFNSNELKRLMSKISAIKQKA